MFLEIVNSDHIRKVQRLDPRWVMGPKKADTSAKTPGPNTAGTHGSHESRLRLWSDKK